ncbi:hypothetical protein [Tropicimonas isoalkanivorans]|uniref:NifU-like domain-containing protein n=1 Tax=Tropicimonas isoalkanivorans TaxID=441112 RepID=A0A1I1HZZ7_9RHOB|nr:hypothetical protein [Tropicimonas isoalkanivorans]SFC29749.1 hypothetical protein SAMN04488094_103352 [Tropicimonas isoalkanivorans]
MSLTTADVVAQFERMVASMGVSLTLVGTEGTVATVQYGSEGDPTCDICVFSTDDLKAMLEEAFVRNNVGPTEVKFV